MLKRLKHHLPEIIIFLIFLGIIISNQLHLAYPDEFENLLGGKFLINGLLPYKHFFTHHNPFAYFFAATIYVFSGASFVKFRIILGLLYFLGIFVFYSKVKQNFGRKYGHVWLAICAFILFGTTYIWGQMLLADTLSAYLLLPVFFYIFITIYHNKNIGAQETIFLSTLTALGVITSMSTIYGASIIYLFIGYLFIHQKINVPVKKFIAIMAIPYLIFIAYLITTNSTKDFYNQSILYNANTYVKLPDGASFKNPVRVAIVFQYYFFQNFKSAILMVKDLNFSSPFAQALVLGNVSLLIFLVFKRKPLSVLFFWLFLSFASVRGNPYTTTETDYQAILYHLTSLSASIFALFFIWHELSKPQLPANRKAVYTTVLIFNSLFMLFLGLFFFDRWFEKTYQKYAGLAPLIYDRPPLAVILNNLISQQEQYIVYPFNFEDQLYLHSKPASKYIVFLPGMDGNAQIESDVIESIKTQKPPVIVFNTELHIYGSQPGKKVFEYVSQNYSNLETLAQTECLTIKSANKILGHSEQTYDFERHIFFLNERKKELLDKLTNLNLIQTQPKSPCSR